MDGPGIYVLIVYFVCGELKVLSSVVLPITYCVIKWCHDPQLELGDQFGKLSIRVIIKHPMQKQTVLEQ